jgi:outer membrane protein assembly factor BamB
MAFMAFSIALATVAGTTRAHAQSCLCGTAADELVAARAGLDREWVVQVPFDSAAWRLEHVVVGDRLVVAQGGDGTVAAIRTDSRPGGARRGAVAWSQKIGGTGPIEAAGIGGESVIVVRGFGITAFDANSGRMAWTRRLSGIASAGGLASGGEVYTPLDGRGVERLPESAWVTVPIDSESDGLVEGAKVRFSLDSKGEVDFKPVAFGNGVLWCSARGLIMALVTEGDLDKRLEFDLGSPASGSPVVRDGDVFVATRAGDLARIATTPAGLTANAGVVKKAQGQETPFFGWHTVLEGVPEGSPVVGGGTVVISLGPWGIAAFDASNGERRWQVSPGGRPLAITDSRVWCLDDTGFLVARDLMSGGRRERLCVGGFTLPVVSTTSERLVLASPGGLVASLVSRRVSTAEPVVAPAAEQPEQPAEAEPVPAEDDDV